MRGPNFLEGSQLLGLLFVSVKSFHDGPSTNKKENSKVNIMYPKNFVVADMDPSTAKIKSNKATIPCAQNKVDMNKDSNSPQLNSKE